VISPEVYAVVVFMAVAHSVDPRTAENRFPQSGDRAKQGENGLTGRFLWLSPG
jgi:hypothetical protein